MPRLPSVEAYGQRPSLRTTRVDPVFPEGVEVAESITRAAQVFAQAYGQKQQKDSRINYALAKNEILALDLRVRQGIKERDDYENFDLSYTTDFQAGADEILARHDRLTPEDRALFQSEIDLVRERGRASVAEFGTGVRIDLTRRQTVEDLEMFAEMAQMTIDNQDDRNGYIAQGLETIMAAEEDGAYTQEEAGELSQAFATSIATQGLENMPAEERLDEVRLAILWKEKHGTHLTREMAANNEGSGSLGDFLPLAALRKIEDATEKEIETEEWMALGQTASDEAWAKFPGLEQGSDRDRYIREATQGNPEARTEGLLRSSQRLAREEKAETLKQNKDYQDAYNAIVESDGEAQVAPDIFSGLPPTLQKDLNDVRKQELENKDWAFSTDWAAREAWDQLTDGQKAKVIFHTDPPEYQQEQLAKQGYSEAEIEEIVANAGLWTDVHGQQHAWRATVSADRAAYMSADRAAAIARVSAGGSLDHTGSLGQEKLLENHLIASPYFDRKPTAAKEDDEARVEWARISDEYNRQLVELHDKNVVIDDTKRLEVLGNIMIKEVQIRRKLGDDELLYAAMSRADWPEGYIPHDKEIRVVPGEEPTTLDRALMRIPTEYGGSPTGDKEYVRDWMKKRIASANNIPVEDVDTDELEEVWFYLLTQGWGAAEARIQRTYGY